MTKPIIFLAFANDRQPGGAYLRNLPAEARSIEAALRTAEQANLCALAPTKPNVTFNELLGVFRDPRYRHQIAIFHYGGHANAYQLLLESNEGNLVPATASGFATFLAQQRGLHLVFLNGCSTEPQVQALLAAGVSIVIATAQAIDDKLATTFATHFYQGLASGATIQSAFDEAVGASRTQSGDDLRTYYIGDAHPHQPAADRWPWALYQRPGSAIATQWNLPQAADNPLFGLPPLPALDLPPHPFRYLQYFRRADAPIFFGRSHQIRALYTRIAAAHGAPIILLYGQSGVGKSSLLAAGLLPRLEADHQVRYLPRNQATGLLGTLATGLDLADATAADEVAAHLAIAWRAQEQAKPLTIILDQAEELYTRPQPDPQAELGDFLTALVAIFNAPSQRPQGKLLLSFRKEYLSELKQRLTARELPFAELFLERLDQQGIREAITGITQVPHLQQHYRLTVAADLAATIAQDLRADQGAAIAPMLQILLSKLWDRARARNYDQPHFDLALYAELRAQGLLLSDFLDQQLSALRQAHPAAVDIGLALDLLAFHTTRLGTAEQRTLSELYATYPDQKATIQSLVQQGRDLYLLADPAENRPDQEPATRLAHDTLAPLIRARFDESDLPGQRARRILESRAIDWANGQEGPLLDEADLALVEVGSLGMRVRSPDEERLVAASVAMRNQRQAEQRRLETERKAAAARELAQAQALAAEKTRRAQTFRWAAIITGFLLLIAIVVSFIAYAQQRAAVASQATAQAQSTRANEARATSDFDAALAATRAAEAQAAQATAEANRIEALNQARLAKAGELTAAAGREVAQPVFDPSLALLLASQAVTMTQLADGPIFINAVATLDEVVRKTQFWRMTLQGHTDTVNAAVFSPDGQRILTASWDNTAILWEATTGRALHILQGHTDTVNSAVFSPDGQRILTASNDNTAILWDAATGQPLHTLKGHTGTVNSAIFSPDGQRILSASDDNSAILWDVTTGQALHTLKGHTDWVTSVSFSPDGQRILTASDDNTAILWEATTGQALHTLKGHTSWVNSAVFSPDGQRILTGSDDNTAILWDATTGRALLTLQGHISWVTSAVFSPDSQRILTASNDETAILWDATTGRALHILQGHTDTLNAAIFSPDGQHILTASWDNTAVVWDATTGRALHTLQGHDSTVNAAIFSPDGQHILTASDDNTAILWDATTGRTLHTLQRHKDVVRAAVFSPDGRRILTASNDNTAILWDATTGQVLHTLQGHTGAITSAVFSPDGRRILTASFDKTAILWDAQAPLGHGQALHILRGHTRVIKSAVFSPDGQRILTGSDDKTAIIWDATTGQVLHVLQGHTDTLKSAVFSPDGQRILTSSNDKTAILWDATTGKALHSLQRHTSALTSAVFSPDGQRILTSSNDKTAILWDAQGLLGHSQVLHTLKGHISVVAAAVFSPDGQRILTISWDNTAILWDAATGQPLHTLRGHTDMVKSAVFSPDGQRILTASDDNTAILWDVTSGQALRILRGHTGAVTSAVFSPDSQRILTASDDNTARVWFSSVDDYMTVAHRLIQRDPPEFTAKELERYKLQP